MSFFVSKKLGEYLLAGNSGHPQILKNLAKDVPVVDAVKSKFGKLKNFITSKAAAVGGDPSPPQSPFADVPTVASSLPSIQAFQALQQVL